MFRVRSAQDFGAAMVFIAIGTAGLYFAQDLAFGSAARMGPGYFPTLLSVCILIIGIVVGLRSLSIEGPPIDPIPLRPITIVVLCVVGFGYLIEQLGVAFTAAVLVVAASAARRGANLKESLALAIGMSIFVIGVFVYALGQPLPVFGGR